MFVKERGRINLQWKSCLIYIMLKFCNSVLLINNNFVTPVWFSRGNTFATLVSCLSTYIAALPRPVVTVSKTLSTWQEQLNMKVMVSRSTVCKKEKWDETIKHYVYLETIIQGFFTLALAFLLLSQVKVAKKSWPGSLTHFWGWRTWPYYNLVRAKNLALVQSWRELTTFASGL